jgi:hypothetical protein
MSLTKNVNVTLIANRRRAIEWLPQIHSEAPPSGQNYFRFNFNSHVCGDDNSHCIQYTAHAIFFSITLRYGTEDVEY